MSQLQEAADDKFAQLCLEYGLEEAEMRRFLEDWFKWIDEYLRRNGLCLN